MKVLLTASLVATFLVAASGSGLAQSNAMMQAAAPVNVVMHAQNGSGENGTATLAQKGSDVVVTVSVSHGTTTSQPAHIHTGSCAKLGGVKYPLTNVVNGKSTTTLKGLSLSSLETGGFAINIHKSATDLGTYTSCGGIPKAPAM